MDFFTKFEWEDVTLPLSFAYALTKSNEIATGASPLLDPFYAKMVLTKVFGYDCEVK